MMTSGSSNHIKLRLVYKLSALPEEMISSSVTLCTELAARTAELTQERRAGMDSTAAAAFVQIVGQVK